MTDHCIEKLKFSSLSAQPEGTQLKSKVNDYLESSMLELMNQVTAN